MLSTCNSNFDAFSIFKHQALLNKLEQRLQFCADFSGSQCNVKRKGFSLLIINPDTDIIQDIPILVSPSNVFKICNISQDNHMKEFRITVIWFSMSIDI